MTYSIFPRSMDSSGRVYCGKAFGIERSNRSRSGMRSSRATRAKVRHFVDISWDGVWKDHLAPLETLLDSTLGVGLFIAPSFRCDARLTSAYLTTGGIYLYVNETAPFTTYLITITDSVNDRLDFSVDGVNEVTAILTPGSYTPSAVAAHVTEQMNAVSGGSVYSVTYSANDDRFTIAETSSGTPTGRLDLLFFSGTNEARGIGATLGYDSSRDKTEETSYISQFFKAPYGSRVLLSDISDGFATTVLKEVVAVDALNSRLTIATFTGHTYGVGSIVEPVFNASFTLDSQDGESVWGMESSRGMRSIVSASIRLDEEFNA